MLKHLATALRALVPETSPPHVHFHAGALGRPHVCENARCTSPQLRVHDA
jgi:hypothetical protein